MKHAEIALLTCSVALYTTPKCSMMHVLASFTGTSKVAVYLYNLPYMCVQCQSAIETLTVLKIARSVGGVVVSLL